MQEIKVVKIYPKEYWDLSGSFSEPLVNGKRFYLGLDMSGQMASYFGKIVVVEKLKNQDRNYEVYRIQNDDHFWDWSPEAFQEVYKQEEYPEYFI